MEAYNLSKRQVLIQNDRMLKILLSISTKQIVHKIKIVNSLKNGTRNRAFFDILVMNMTIKYVSIFFVPN